MEKRVCDENANYRVCGTLIEWIYMVFNLFEYYPNKPCFKLYIYA